MRANSGSQQLEHHTIFRLYLVEPPTLEIFGELLGILARVKLYRTHVLVWLGRLENPQFTDLLLERINELAKFDDVHVRRHCRATDVLRVDSYLTLFCVQLTQENVTGLNVIVRVASPKLL